MSEAIWDDSATTAVGGEPALGSSNHQPVESLGESPRLDLSAGIAGGVALAGEAVCAAPGEIPMLTSTEILGIRERAGVSVNPVAQSIAAALVALPNQWLGTRDMLDPGSYNPQQRSVHVKAFFSSNPEELQSVLIHNGVTKGGSRFGYFPMGAPAESTKKKLSKVRRAAQDQPVAWDPETSVAVRDHVVSEDTRILETVGQTFVDAVSHEPTNPHEVWGLTFSEQDGQTTIGIDGERLMISDLATKIFQELFVAGTDYVSLAEKFKDQSADKIQAALHQIKNALRSHKKEGHLDIASGLRPDVRLLLEPKLVKPVSDKARPSPSRRHRVKRDPVTTTASNAVSPQATPRIQKPAIELPKLAPGEATIFGGMLIVGARILRMPTATHPALRALNDLGGKATTRRIADHLNRHKGRGFQATVRSVDEAFDIILSELEVADCHDVLRESGTEQDRKISVDGFVKLDASTVG